MKMTATWVQRCIALAVIVLFVAMDMTSGGGQSMAASAKSRWGANYFPNVTLLTQDGEKVAFYDDLIKDKVVAINFIYTQCADSCPLETAKMRQVYNALGDRVGKDVFMYSISIDPKRDTPDVLKAYKKKFRIDARWTFLTGATEDIELIRKKLGVYIEEIQGENGEIGDHNVTLMIGNEATGRWMKRSPFENPKLLATLLGQSLQAKRQHAIATQVNYAQAAQLPSVNRGEQLFRTRCTGCHSIGKGEGLGPDLIGVVSLRDRDWLTRWLMRPDEMLEEKDPLAISLYKKYNNLPMPNLKLNNLDTVALIDYMQKESKRLSKLSRSE